MGNSSGPGGNAAGARAACPGNAPPHRRYLSNQPQRYQAYLHAARTYVGRLREGEFYSLYQKPFDRNPGNESFYRTLYPLLNLLQAMHLTPGRIVEVGSGPGWVTEILMGLGFEVDAVEPAAAMIEVAQERLARCVQHHRIANPPRVTFHAQCFEECSLPDACADGVLFHESLHHVLDEDKALAQAFRVLRPGGVLGISGEPNWQPGNPAQESFWEEEMARFGTLESPYTWEYLHYLLNKHGFQDVCRYHGVNGLFPVEQEQRTIKEVAQFPAQGHLTVTARKRGAADVTTADPRAVTRGEIHVLAVSCDKAWRKVQIRVKLVNRGETTWLHRASSAVGWVTLALAQGKPGRPYHREALSRCPLPHPLPPGGEVVLDAVFFLPEGYEQQPWYLDLVNESLFWFSSRGSSPVAVKWPAS